MRIDAAEELELFRRWHQHGDLRARDRIATYTMGLASYYAERMATAYRVEPEELTAEAYLGVADALGRFKPELGYRFSTFAMVWIRCRVMKSIEDHHGATSHGGRKAFWKAPAAIRALTAHGLEAVPSEIAAELGVREQDVLDWMNRRRKPDVRLDERIGDDESSTKGDNFAGTEQPADEKMLEHEREQTMRRAIRRLSPRDAHIIRSRFLDDPPDTLEDIGKRMNLSRERVRQLQLTALNRLRVLLHDQEANT